MRFVIRRARRGHLRRNQVRVVLVGDNGEPLLTSESYNNLGDAEHLIEIVRAHAATADVHITPNKETG